MKSDITIKLQLTRQEFEDLYHLIFLGRSKAKDLVKKLQKEAITNNHGGLIMKYERLGLVARAYESLRSKLRN